ncbi:MAG: ribonuclease III [Clostridia bacterium]
MDVARKVQLHELTTKLGIDLQKLDILNTALIHPTYAYEHPRHAEHNQRLEFLGDAVLNVSMAEYLYLSYPGKSEGELTKIRAEVVSEQGLAIVAQRLAVGKYLLLGKGEEASGGRERISILADAVEAIFAAVYLELGFAYVKKMIIEILLDQIIDTINNGSRDYKTKLQEILQKNQGETATYRILEATGPEHDKTFLAGVYQKDRLLGEGEGKSKKDAEQNAAKTALELL